MANRARHASQLAAILAVAATVALACTVPNPDYCDMERPCTRLDAPFCDLTGEFGKANACVPFPVDAAPGDRPVSTDADRPDSTGVALLMVSLTVMGPGTVTSVPSGIECGISASSCSQAFPMGSSVTLTWTVETGAVFSGWGGDCSGAANDCIVVVAAPRLVTASFFGTALAAANTGPNTVYRPTTIGWSSAESDLSRSVAWGDYDGDGDLDLAVGNGLIRS